MQRAIASFSRHFRRRGARDRRAKGRGRSTITDTGIACTFVVWLWWIAARSSSLFAHSHLFFSFFLFFFLRHFPRIPQCCKLNSSRRVARDDTRSVHRVSSRLGVLVLSSIPLIFLWSNKVSIWETIFIHRASAFRCSRITIGSSSLDHRARDRSLKLVLTNHCFCFRFSLLAFGYSIDRLINRIFICSSSWNQLIDNDIHQLCKRACSPVYTQWSAKSLNDTSWISFLGYPSSSVRSFDDFLTSGEDQSQILHLSRSSSKCIGYRFDINQVYPAAVCASIILSILRQTASSTQGIYGGCSFLLSFNIYRNRCYT